MWKELILNPNSITSIYGIELPSLNNALINKFSLDHNGPTGDLSFEVENYPLTPPVKWLQNGYNTAQIWMKFIDIVSLKINGWNINNCVNIRLTKIEEELYFNAEGPDCYIKIRFKWLDAGVMGYYKENT